MVAGKKSVVTPERFASGKTYAEYRESINSYSNYGSRYDQNYEGTELTEDDVRDFKKLVEQPDGPAKVLIVTEDWCPDCYREVPVMARIAEPSGMELRILERDQNKDVMAEFLKDGEFESIPTFVFYTRDHRYITHWIERSKYAAEQGPIMRKVFEGLSQEERQEASAKYQKEHWHTWRRATIDELKEILTKSRPA
jgi:thiol-disulfide isomerase/thioredoxin